MKGNLKMKKLISVFLVFALVLAFAACGKKAEETTTESTAEEISEEVTDEVTEAGETASEAVTEESKAEDASATEAETAEGETSETAAEEKTTIAPPANTQEIITLYNNAVNNAYDKKAGFSKERYTDNANYDMSVALRAFKGLVEKFIGIGEDNKYTETVTKGKWDEDTNRYYLRKSTLSASDVTNATCTESGGVYTVTLGIKGGSSVGNKNTKSTNAPVDKCGICVGNKDKNYYDHKTAEVIYDAIAGTYEGADIKESYSNAKAVAKINAETGELISLTVVFDISVDIDISIGSGNASGTTHITYKDFKY